MRNISIILQNERMEIVREKVMSLLISAALVVFAMAAGAACYHQYLVQRDRLRASPPVYMPPSFPEEGRIYTYKEK